MTFFPAIFCILAVDDVDVVVLIEVEEVELLLVLVLVPKLE